MEVPWEDQEASGAGNEWSARVGRSSMQDYVLCFVFLDTVFFFVFLDTVTMCCGLCFLTLLVSRLVFNGNGVGMMTDSNDLCASIFRCLVRFNLKDLPTK